MEKTIFEALGGSYTEVGEISIPNIEIRESVPIGKWGRMRKKYLQEEHPLVFSELLLSEKLWPHLVEVDETCQERLALLETQMSAREGVTEALKAADQMEWLRRMESIHSRTEEIVIQELIYPEEAEDK